MLSCTVFLGKLKKKNPKIDEVEQTHSNAVSTFIYSLPVKMDQKKKKGGDLKKVLAKISIVRWHISLVKLELETVQSISVIICLGTPSIFPDPTLIIVFLLA